MGPLVALANTLANLPRLKVLDISDCCLIGLAKNRYHGLNALGSAFAGTKHSLTHLRYDEARILLPMCCAFRVAIPVAVFQPCTPNSIASNCRTPLIYVLLSHLCSPLLRRVPMRGGYGVEED